MRIACPKCAAEYDVPASRLKPQKMVRCARCGDQWSPVRATEEPSPAPAPVNTATEHEPEPPPLQMAPLPPVTAMDRLAASGVKPRQTAGLAAAWVMTFVILAAAVAATIVWREAIIRAWPPSSRILGSADHAAPVPAQKPGPPAEAGRPTKE